MKSHRPRQCGSTPYSNAKTSMRLLSSRNPVTRSGDTFRAKFRSHKSADPIRCESLLEFKATALLEFARNINQYTHQPPKLSLRIDGKTRRYTPDFAGSYADGQGYLLVEVKPETKANKPVMRKKLLAARDAAWKQGCRFAVVTERHLMRPGIADIRRLLKIRRDFAVKSIGGPPIDESLRATADSIWAESPVLQRTFESKRYVTVSEATRLMGGGVEAQWSLDVLLLARILAWSIGKALQPSTKLHMYTEADDDQLFF